MLDTLTVKAHGLARTWGITLTTTVMRPVSPCPRPHCGGSILAMGGGRRRCLLCARDNGTSSEQDLAREAELRELMTV